MHKLLKHRTIILVTIIVVSSCRTVFYNIPNISDYKIFPHRIIKNAPQSVFYFSKSDNIENLGKLIFTDNHTLWINVVTLDEYVEGSRTAAFIIIRNDTIIYEKYNKKYQENSIFNIFSVMVFSLFVQWRVTACFDPVLNVVSCFCIWLGFSRMNFVDTSHSILLNLKVLFSVIISLGFRWSSNLLIIDMSLPVNL